MGVVFEAVALVVVVFVEGLTAVRTAERTAVVRVTATDVLVGDLVEVIVDFMPFDEFCADFV